MSSGSDVVEAQLRWPPDDEYAAVAQSGRPCHDESLEEGFTSTPVPRYSGKSSWEQYRQVFEAIVCSNGWDGVAAALQLLSHLDGDALNVALLFLETQRVLSGVLVRALSEHYGSPGRLQRVQTSIYEGFPSSGR